MAFSEADFVPPPAILGPGNIDEIGLSNTLMQQSGSVKAIFDNNRVTLQFTDNRSIVNQVTAPLDIELARQQAKNPDQYFGQITLGRKYRFTMNDVNDIQFPDTNQ